MFHTTNIETYGYCNRQCSFCFNAPRFKKRKQGIMPEWLWNKLIDDLVDMDYTGRIGPYLYGEPLMDKRLPELIGYASERLEGAIVIATNGDFLTAQLLEKLIKNGLTYLLVTEYDEELSPEILCLKANYPEYIRYRHYSQVNDFIDRAGKIFGNKTIYHEPCLRQAKQLAINWEGKVLLCCCDYYGEHMFGNVNTQSLKEIWNSKKFKKVRNWLNRGQREKVNICKYCTAR